LQLKFNEDYDSIAYDSSGNNNYGVIINNVTWQNDGVLKTLTEDVDYSLNSATGILSLLDNSYLYSFLIASWTTTKAITTVADINFIDLTTIQNNIGGFFIGFVALLGIMGVIIGIKIIINKLRESKDFQQLAE